MQKQIDAPLRNFISVVGSKKMIIAFILLTIMSSLVSFISLIPAYFIKIIFDNISHQFDMVYLFQIIMIFIVFFLITSVLEILNTYFYIKSLNSTSLIFRDRFLNAYLTNDYFKLLKYSEGDIIYRGNTDIQNICELSFELIIKTFAQMFFLIVIIYFMLKSNYILSISVILLLIIEYLYNYLFSNKLKNKIDKLKASESSLLETYKQIMSRYIYIRLNRMRKFELSRFKSILKNVMLVREKYIISQTYIFTTSNIISSFRQLFVIACGAYLISRGDMTIGLLIAFNQLCQSLVSPASYFSSLIHHYKNLVSSYERIQEIMDCTVSDSKTKSENIKNQPNLAVLCEHLKFKIGNNRVINDLNLKVNHMEKIAIIGESGSGKSTFCKLLAGLYEYEGKIFIEEENNNKSINLSFMLDESSLFRGTLSENLMYGIDGKEVTRRRIMEVFNKVKLDYFTKYLDNADLIIDKNTLSKGEKQRLELARIMLIKPNLIILDEPTSGLDEYTEEIVWRNFRDECSKSTIIYTTHKREIIHLSDRIFKMTNGILTEIQPLKAN
ncbi:ATP-binding cassette domain-containing protein [Paenibacillus illinoisensis]|uniref:ATP-binding cassette domain-containing protein n=1 Tax=Paenibacillus illinoisensis TaxID=59845 RepID=UPI00203E4425|nr:ABC transporter ATP-binding protein [Paenibacillus illinoisensis]MCM3205986.1 ABC transporter ATP-binding protein/permease [Paenibacillus illinoisensis]